MKTIIPILLFSAFNLQAGPALSINPRNLDEILFRSSDMGVEVESDVAYADYDFLRQNYDFLKTKSNAEIDIVLKRSFSVLSSTQLKGEGLFFEFMPGFKPSQHPRRIYRQESYERAGNLPFILASGEKIGVLDVKGLGIRPENLKSGEIMQALKIIRGDLPFDLPSLVAMHNQRAATIKAIDGLKGMTNLNPIQQYSFEYHLDLEEIKFKALTILIDSLGHVANGGFTVPERHLLFLKARSAVAEMDYVNGLFPLDRGIKEIITETATRKIYGEHNVKHGTNYLTVRNIAVLAPKINIFQSNGLRRAGFLLRVASNRDDQTKSDQTPMPIHIVDPVLAGGYQSDAFGRQIDFEIPGLVDPRIAPIYRQNGYYLQEAIKAITPNGNQQTFTQFVNETLVKLKDLPDSSNDRDLNLETDKLFLEKRIHHRLRMLIATVAFHSTEEINSIENIQHQNKDASLAAIEHGVAGLIAEPKVIAAAKSNSLSGIYNLNLSHANQLAMALVPILLKSPSSGIILYEFAERFNFISEIDKIYIFSSLIQSDLKAKRVYTDLHTLGISKAALLIFKALIDPALHDNFGVSKDFSQIFENDLEAIQKLTIDPAIKALLMEDFGKEKIKFRGLNMDGMPSKLQSAFASTVAIFQPLVKHVDPGLNISCEAALSSVITPHHALDLKIAERLRILSGKN